MIDMNNMNMHNPKFYGTATVGERGQVVIPSEAREKLNLSPGDKMLVLMPRDNIIVLVKPSEFEKHFEHMMQKAKIIKDQINNKS